MTLIALLVTFIYVILIGAFIFGFDKVEDFKLEDLPASTKFTVVIPFRNESKNLPGLLKSINELEYPSTHFEIVFVDDESTDNSVELITSFIKKSKKHISLIENIRSTKSPKKDAITTAISNAKYNWIVTTDADCVLPKYWLDTFDCFIQKQDTQFIVAPVVYVKSDSFLNRFQILDFLSLQGATIGSFGINKPFLCNGANLAFSIDLFKLLNGYEGNTNIASGDDIFLLEKAVKKDSKLVHYLKSPNVMVTTVPQPNLNGLISQRLRWAAKTSSYGNLFGKLTGLSVVCMNAFLICLLMFFIVGIVPAKTLMYVFLIKFGIDFLLLYKTSRFFDNSQLLLSYFFSSLLYPFFNVFVAFASVFSGYRWKGRAYHK
ncbi:cellulose synthase/poly-beta-1,6-N-acetylglucosamine synthase-like glycosyltransferase [Flavobacteriaceae bacterium MAR_2010_72]|nr:cellulose synthase/poly-beta-1,6-N-acetylglucosamine synthase-like glycosyltransferase [Flavobacteriaceae bacterium MAR_2010_72]